MPAVVARAGPSCSAPRVRRRRVEEFVYYDDIDPDCLRNGIVEIDGRRLGDLWRHCRDRGLAVVADVHVHPGGYAQSGSDTANPIMAEVGHVAVILPDFAAKRTRPGGIGVFRYLGARRWADLSGGRSAGLHVGWWPIMALNAELSRGAKILVGAGLDFDTAQAKLGDLSLDVVVGQRRRRRPGGAGRGADRGVRRPAVLRRRRSRGRRRQASRYASPLQARRRHARRRRGGARRPRTREAPASRTIVMWGRRSVSTSDATFGMVRRLAGRLCVGH